MAMTSYQLKRRVGYAGWHGHGNLGDDALFDVFGSLFPEVSPCWPKSFVDRAVHKIMGRTQYFRAGFLGGGTLIFNSSYSEPVEDWLARGIPVYCFGTVVIAVRTLMETLRVADPVVLGVSVATGVVVYSILALRVRSAALHDFVRLLPNRWGSAVGRVTAGRTA